MRTGLLFLLTAALMLSFALGGMLAAAPSPEQIQKLKAAEAALRKAGADFNAGNFKGSAEQLKQAQSLVAEIKDIDDLQRQLAPIVVRLQRAHALLEIEGISLPPLDLPAVKQPAGKTPAKRANPTAKRGSATGTSFVKQVAPILIAKCGRCHVNETRGGLSMASFASLERGNQDGRVIFPGKAEGSRLIEVIETGDMPRGGLRVSKEELATLRMWIDAGARFDGTSTSDPLAALVPGASPAEAPRLEVQAATGSESVTFSRDVAPILVKNCFDCHGPGRQNGGQLSLRTFSGVVRGGQSGVIIGPGKPADSLIVKKLRGMAGAQMPLRRDPLPESDIAVIETWIAEGARYDASDPNQSLEFIAAVTRARSLTHEQLAADRAELAKRNWRLALPDEAPDERETKNFFLLGNIGEEPLEELARVAEQQATAIAKMLRAPDDQPLVKGRITLFAFNRRIDYSEWRNVDGREIPAAWRGHWKYDAVEAYACLVPPTADEYGLAPLVAQHVAAIHVASLGRAPAWFADGAGRLTASRLDPRDARIRQWDNRTAQALSGRWSADDFLAGKLPPEHQELLNYALVKALAANAPKYQGLLANLRQGADFDAAFLRAYGASPRDALGSWTGRPASARE